MRKINLKEIFFNTKFNKESLTESEQETVINQLSSFYSFEDILNFAKEAIRQSLELAAENATAYYFTDKYSNSKPTNAVDAIVDKDSILDTLNQVE